MRTDLFGVTVSEPSVPDGLAQALDGMSWAREQTEERVERTELRFLVKREQRAGLDKAPRTRAGDLLPQLDAVLHLSLLPINIILKHVKHEPTH